ncbi:teicoplanin resistance protein VanZ, partial [Turicibacter sanguinis]|nr:teicoplanin resistance protein VanZ [Turicibacter sanguinis]
VKETVETSPKPTESQREILYQKVHYIVRKSAHFFEYAVLGGLAFWMFQGFRVTFWNQVIYSLFMILSVAVMDEYLQSFVARTSSVSDILIDFSGGMTGVLILYLIKKAFR